MVFGVIVFMCLVTEIAFTGGLVVVVLLRCCAWVVGLVVGAFVLVG